MSRPAPTKPLIGLTGRRKPAASFDGFPDTLSRIPIDLYLADYANEVTAAGGLPVHLPTDADPCEYLPHLDAIVLTGGADLQPSLYGADPDGNGDYDEARDRRELRLLTGARAAKLPILGICRGLQLINVERGGTLHQHVPDHARYDVIPETRVHDVTFEPESLLGALYGSAGPQALTVNSLHHQTVDRLGSGLRVVATAPDGTVEGLESDDGTMVAVQWHPEMLTEPEPVFGWIVEQAARQRANG